MLFASTEQGRHWLERLRLIEAPDGTALRSAELSFRGLLPVWLALLLLVAACALAMALYFRENVRLGPSWRVVLALLRTALVGLVLALLLRPVLLAEFAGSRPRSVVLLLDDSQSMTQADRRVSDADRLRAAIARNLIRPTSPVSDGTLLANLPEQELAAPRRIDLVQEVLANPRLDLLNSLGRKGPVQTFLFDGRLHGVESGPPPLPSRGGQATPPSPPRLKADGPRTALADAIHEVLVRQAAELPAAIVVMTDGRDNASKLTLDEAARLCRDKGAPLHIYGVGSAEAGALQLKEVKTPRTIFIDEKTEAVDDPVEIPIRFRCRGFKKGTVVVTVELGTARVTETFPIQEGENLTRLVKITPRKGKEGERPVAVRLHLRDAPEVGDEVRKTVQVKTSRVKVLYVENVPRREYKFIQPALDRDRRVLLRLHLIEGDPRLAETAPDAESGALYVERFPENFPDPTPRDPDRRPYDLLILGDVPYAALGDRGAKAVRQFVKEGGGLVLLAGRNHALAEYARTPLAEVLPVDVSATPAAPEQAGRDARAYRPVLTHDGEQSPLLSLADASEDNLRLWKDDLWKYTPGFYWHSPVQDLKPAATALLVHPEKKVGRPPHVRALPLAATQLYGKGEVLFLGFEETWRWRDNTGDRLTARFWGQIAAQLGLPHLLGNSRRTQLELERGGAVLGRVGAVKARLLDRQYEPITRPLVRATLLNLDAADAKGRSREVLLRRVPGQPGEYRGALPNDAAGRHELRIAEGDAVEAGSLPYRVELPPRHEMEQIGLAEEALQSAAAASGGAFYREEDLHRLADAVETQAAPFVQRQEILLWNPLALVLFVVLITAEWLLRKFSNLS